ncbi:hypothetical protein [Candidatus Enterovibrio escicola]|uniref:hypothetical protein n=1 Tax=Candidatus Enterovibrio escicola TaxID=1927127 RepID=UPI0016806E0C|nr:hypothetical protein [Candidatus Enterovibrio escacola]
MKKCFFKQWLSGDTTEGYSGCIGIGTATALLEEEPFAWEACVHTIKSGKR